jgi:hypothetical protein
VPSLRTAMIQKQKCIVLNVVALSNYKITTVGDIMKKETGTNTFIGTGSHLTCE